MAALLAKLGAEALRAQFVVSTHACCVLLRVACLVLMPCSDIAVGSQGDHLTMVFWIRDLSQGGVWRKTAISAKNQARLRKEALLDGRQDAAIAKASAFELPDDVGLCRARALCLRRVPIVVCREWFGDTGAPVTPPKRRKAKGHKFEREAVLRCGLPAVLPASMCGWGFICRRPFI